MGKLFIKRRNKNKNTNYNREDLEKWHFPKPTKTDNKIEFLKLSILENFYIKSKVNISLSHFWYKTTKKKLFLKTHTKSQIITQKNRSEINRRTFFKLSFDS